MTKIPSPGPPERFWKEGVRKRGDNNIRPWTPWTPSPFPTSTRAKSRFRCYIVVERRGSVDISCEKRNGREKDTSNKSDATKTISQARSADLGCCGALSFQCFIELHEVELPQARKRQIVTRSAVLWRGAKACVRLRDVSRLTLHTHPYAS